MERGHAIVLCLIVARAILAAATLVAMIAPVTWASRDHVELDLYIGPDAHGGARREVDELSFAQVREVDANERWNVGWPLALLALITWEGIAHRRAARSRPRRAASGATARFVLFFVVLATIVVATFDLHILDHWEARFGAHVLDAAVLAGLAGAAWDFGSAHARRSTLATRAALARRVTAAGP
jgi:hypothetical protein